MKKRNSRKIRIAYGVAGEGMGHAIRSRPIIEELSRHYDVLVFAGSRAYDYLSKRFRTVRVTSMHTHYVDNKVSIFGSLAMNLAKLGEHTSTLKHIVEVFEKFRPDVIVSDFEFFTAYAAVALKIPFIEIYNGSIITEGKIEFPKKFLRDYANAAFVVKMFVPRADYQFIPSFFSVPLKSRNAEIVPPVLRKEILELNPKNNNHILVYQTSSSNKRLLELLKKTKERFVVYGFNVEKKDKNLLFKKFNETGFFTDLASCRAVIANGGFTLLTEALHLGKPVLSEPVRGQFEQVLNAYYLQKLGYGMFVEKITLKSLRRFLSKLSFFARNLEKYKKSDNSLLLSKLRGVIDDFAKKQTA